MRVLLRVHVYLKDVSRGQDACVCVFLRTHVHLNGGFRGVGKMLAFMSLSTCVSQGSFAGWAMGPRALRNRRCDQSLRFGTEYNLMAIPDGPAQLTADA